MQTNQIYNESCLETLKRMPDDFLDCVITSPPYFGLRSYNTEPQIWGGDEDCQHQWGEFFTPPNGGKSHPDRPSLVGANRPMNDMPIRGEGHTSHFCHKCGAWCGELGLEPTFQLYLSHLLDIFREVKRVLKPTGTVWVNLGDSFNGNKIGNTEIYKNPSVANGTNHHKILQASLRPKSLMNIPHRFYIAMTDELGMIQRNNIVWHKAACMPSSAKDRFTVDFESIGFFTKNERYYFEQQLEDIKQVSLDRVKTGWSSTHPSIGEIDVEQMGERFASPDGRNMRSTWSINFEPSGDEHYASYPTRLVERMMRAGCPESVCKKCGVPRQKVIETKSTPTKRETYGEQPSGNGHQTSTGWQPPERKELGYTDCGCGAGWDSGIVYDPFGGTATTAVVAHRLGRRWICSELQPKYVEISENRLEPLLNQNRLFV